MLETLLALNAFHLLLVFTRLGTAFMLFPGFSAVFVSANIRLILAVALSVVCLPAVQGTLPSMPGSIPALVLLLAAEAGIGAFLGLMAQFLLVSVSLAGTVIGFSTGLMMAQAFDPVNAQQSAIVSGFLSQAALVLLMVMGLHHLMIEAVVGSYQVFLPGSFPDTGDTLRLFTQMLTGAFRIGWQIAAPFIVYSILFNTTLGILARLMPQLNVLFIAMPLQIMAGLGLLMTAGPLILTTFLGELERGLRPLAIP
ncbi:flagellar biosynthetic protein FliR [Pararhodospirillum oryzae]|uniref:Flagellar biosynthetic protein FliR n=1 Tax=Pararhodospirillum oryzae TaxID=478448 RepID=A0A512H4A4_9PROT|nr:flagellar biosynthetic protein FliR [Pararhodospirillum oryzae]GEO80295.1 flagellar biosynthetic protein FliR [Pararhodospirillum oryzae]